MNTDDLIRRLADDNAPARRPSLTLWLAGASLAGLAGMAATVTLLPISPVRPDLAARAFDLHFLAESSLWLSLAAAGFALVYRLAVPGLWRRGDAKWGAVPALLLAAVVALRFEGGAPAWVREMDWIRGFCGPVILWVGLLQAALLGWLVRKAAPTNLAAAGFWIAFGSGALGSFLMQFVCPKENFAHVVLWHMAPVLLLGAAGALLGRKALKW